MNAIGTLSSILGLGLASGVNLYAAVLVVGLGIRYGWLSGLPGDLNLLASPLILGAAGVMYFLEFFADKIPYVSVAWDSIHTFIRPLGGAVLALASAANLRPELQVLAILTGGSLALGTHSTKMGYRLLAHASPEPVSDVVFSMAEDFGVVGLVLLTYTHPAIAIGVVAVLVIGMALVLPWIWRVLLFGFHGIAGRLASLFPQPGAEQESYPCFARTVPKVPRMKKGTLIWKQDKPVFVLKGLVRTREIEMEAGPLTLTRGLLFDVLSAGEWNVYLTKDCHAGAMQRCC